MKRWHKESEENKQIQIHMTALIASMSVLVLVSTNTPSIIYAQNTNSTLNNATAVESHTTNTTGTLLMQLLLLHHPLALQKILPS